MLLEEDYFQLEQSGRSAELVKRQFESLTGKPFYISNIRPATIGDGIISLNDNEKKIEIPIIDNNEWEPDLDFLVELYEIDGPNKARLIGDDTQCRVTILDEDFPGTLGFETTDIRVNRNQKSVDVVIKRSEGSDGKITCIVKTETLIDSHG